jgi:hypothetical protein
MDPRCVPDTNADWLTIDHNNFYFDFKQSLLRCFSGEEEVAMQPGIQVSRV